MDKAYAKEIEIRKECAYDFELWQYNNSSHCIPQAYKRYWHDYHFIHEKVKKKEIQFKQTSIKHQEADFLQKQSQKGSTFYPKWAFFTFMHQLEGVYYEICND